MNKKTQYNFCFCFDKAKAIVLSEYFFILLAVTTSAEAQPANTAIVPIDLSTWSVVQFELNDQDDANWELSNDNTLVTQTVNADASIFLSDFTLTNDKIEGNFRVNTSDDDDLIGFVFGYQDYQHFYLFDWKQGSQDDPFGFAEQGMSVKLVNADLELTGPDLWPTEGNGERINTLFHNQIGWENFTDYKFSLEFRPGEFTITVSEGNIVLDSVTLQDSSYTSGTFGFYNYSQGLVEYRQFQRTELCQPTIDIALNSNNRVTGDKVVINAHINGPGSSNSSCEQSKVVETVWVKLPDDSVIPLIEPFTGLTLLPGAEIDTKIFEYTFSGVEPIGSYQIGGRLLHPFSGDAISTDIEVLTFSE